LVRNHHWLISATIITGRDAMLSFQRCIRTCGSTSGRLGMDAGVTIRRLAYRRSGWDAANFVVFVLVSGIN